MKTQSFGRSPPWRGKVIAYNRYDSYFFSAHAPRALKDYREQRENGDKRDEPKEAFPAAGLDALKIESSTYKPAGPKGEDYWPDKQGRYWWQLTLEDGKVSEDYYWKKDEVRGFPEKADSNRYWFSVHHAPSGAKIEGFSARPDYEEKGYRDAHDYSEYSYSYIQYDECGPIKQWMEEKDRNYGARFQSEKEIAEQGDVATQYNLGLMYAEGRGVNKDEREALKWMQMAAQQGHAEALGWIKKTAERGSEEAQYSLGLIYAQGENRGEALKWMKKAAEQGYEEAQYSLGLIYAQGENLGEALKWMKKVAERRHPEALKWMKKTAEQGHVATQYNLGLMYAEGRGVSKDEREALKWIQKAAQQGHPEALGWIKKTAERGSEEAQYSLGLIYAQGEDLGEALKWMKKVAERRHPEALKWMKKTAEQGHVATQYNLGLMYAEGRGVSKDEREALKWMQMAAQQGHAEALGWIKKTAERGSEEAQYSLGLIYAQGEDLGEALKWMKKVAERRHPEALKWMKKTAEQGHVATQYNLGLMYAEGRGVSKDEREALKWMQMAAQQGHAEALGWMKKTAEQGHMEAQYRLGLTYAEDRGRGRGIAKDEREALKWIQKAAEQRHAEALVWIQKTANQGYAEAQYNLGCICAEGRGVAKDDAVAVQWYRLAAEQRHAEAQYNLGLMYTEGRGVSKDQAKAMEWTQKAAEQNHVQAQYNLGLMYAEGRAVAKDDEEAMGWYYLAADQGHADAQYNLGLMYAEGRAVAKDDAEAVEWYRKAVKQEHAGAQNSLGWMYENGRGVAKDDEKAVEWYRKAADQGHAEAQYNLGWMYADGRGVRKNDAEAVKWYRKAAEQKYAGAQNSLGWMYANGRGVRKNDAEAVEWYRKAADQGQADAQSNLGSMYENGRGIAQDDAEAVKWYALAAKQGNGRAQSRLRALEGNLKAAHPQQHPALPLPPVPAAVAAPKMMVKALYPYQAPPGSSGQLSFAAGDLLSLLREDTDWWFCSDKLGREGYVPSNHVSKVLPDIPVPKPKSFPDIPVKPKLPDIFSEARKLGLCIPYEEIALGDKLGAGGFGVVSYGRWYAEEVAVKQLHIQQMTEKTLLSFRDEIMMMARLRSDYIVTFKGIVVEPYSLVMEYMPGGSLFSVLHSDVMLSWSTRHSIALDVARGLVFLHSQKPMIVHRDLKSLNVLLTGYQRAKLANFGLAKVRAESSCSVYSQSKASQKSVGTIPWMAPECFGLEPEYSDKTDIYAYGMVLWEIVSRKIPYEGVLPNIICSAVEAGKRATIPDQMEQLSPYRPSAKTPQSIKSFIKLCWFQETKERPNAMKAVEAFERDIEKDLAPEIPGHGNLDSGFVDNFNSSSSSSFKK